MIGRPFRVNWHPEDTPEALRAAYRAQQDTMLRTRLHALWLLRCGRRMDEVSSVVGIHYRTLQKWVSWYRKGGVEEVLSHMMKGLGQPRFLSEDQERELTEEVASGRFRTGGEIREWIECEYGVSYRLGSVYSLLARLGCSPRVSRGLHEKADVRVQESWKRGARRGALRCGSDEGDGVWVCRRDASGTSWNGAQGVGSSWREGASTSAVGVRVEVPVLCGGRT